MNIKKLRRAQHDVHTAGKIGIDLEGVKENGDPWPEARGAFRPDRGNDDADTVGDDQLFEKAPQDPLRAEADIFIGKRVRLVDF